MTPAEVDAKIREKWGDAVAPALAAVKKGDTFLVVKPEALRAVATWLRDEPGLEFDALTNVTAVDYPKERKLRVTYHLQSYTARHAFVLKVELDRDAATVDSLEPVWKGANWLEREQYDLVGVRFAGHPDLRRIMLPDDWVGHPLRKDWTESPAGYHGMKITRESPLDALVAMDNVRKAKALESAPAEPKPADPAPAATKPA
jgi:NADH-quinone oxidoreductase subunit C